MNDLYEALEICLSRIEQGADLDTVLFGYPDLTDELRPILEASVKAREMSIPAPPEEVVNRNRAKLLQRASEMRERNAVQGSRRVWSVSLRRVFVTLTVLALLFVSGTSLVRAASTALPGDSLYPVKRTWEDVLVLFTLDVDKREELEFEHENERLEELQELFAEGRSAEVEFSGYVTRQSGEEWRVSGVTVVISSQTLLPDRPVNVGAAVQIKGRIQSGMRVIAERIELLPPNSRLPEVEDDDLGTEVEEREEKKPQIKEESVSGSEIGTPEPEAEPSEPEIIITPTVGFEPEDISLSGIVSSIEKDLIVVNGIVMDIRFAEIEGILSIGAIAKAEGYYDANGIYIATKIEFKPAGSGGGSDSNSNETNENSNDDNVNDDDENSNDNDNSLDND